MGFKAVYVFDITQTEGEALPLESAITGIDEKSLTPHNLQGYWRRLALIGTDLEIAGSVGDPKQAKRIDELEAPEPDSGTRSPVPPDPRPPIDGNGGGQPDPKKRTRVRLVFNDLGIHDLAKLMDVAYALEDAKGKVRVEVQLNADNPNGLDESLLELSVRELLAQHGLNADWED